MFELSKAPYNKTDAQKRHLHAKYNVNNFNIRNK